MCFSPTASFATAAATGVVGLLCLRRIQDWREAPLAATPLFFALQQGVEGLLWLCPPAALGGRLPDAPTLTYLILAQCFWPVFAPVAVILAEPLPGRRRLMAPWLAVGATVAGFLLWNLLGGAYAGQALGGHLVYRTPHAFGTAVAVGYLAATILPMLLSSQRIVVGLGVLVAIGCAVAWVAYTEAALSVWCFFAAGASVVILGRFEHAHRLRIAAAVVPA